MRRQRRRWSSGPDERRLCDDDQHVLAEIVPARFVSSIVIMPVNDGEEALACRNHNADAARRQHRCHALAAARGACLASAGTPQPRRSYTITQRTADRIDALNYKGEKRAFHKCPLDALKKPEMKH